MDNYHRNNLNHLHDSLNDYFNSRNYTNKLNNGRLNIVQINMRSIRSFERFDIFKSLIDEFHKRLDVVIVSESWLDRYTFKYYNCLPDYEGFFDGRNYGNSGGGVAVYVKKHLKPKSILTSNDKDFDTVWIELFNEKFGKLNIAAYYRSQRVSSNDLLVSMEDYMNRFGNENCFIGGDMNIDVLHTDGISFRYFNLLNSFGFSISNDKRTRCASGTLLDHAITNFSEKFDIMNDTIDNDFSDHSIVATEICVPLEQESEVFRKEYTNFQLFQLNLIQSLTNESNCQE